VNPHSSKLGGYAEVLHAEPIGAVRELRPEMGDAWLAKASLAKKGHKNRKHGRAERPGQRAKRARYERIRWERKRKHILKSNGATYLKAWEAQRALPHPPRAGG
jgi:hypothetical protein